MAGVNPESIRQLTTAAQGQIYPLKNTLGWLEEGLGVGFPIGRWYELMERFPKFVRIMVALGEAHGFKREDLVPTQKGSERLPQIDMLALGAYIDRVAKEEGLE